MARKQIGVFAYQVKGPGVKVVLVTNRRASRWILPKGRPERHLSDSEVARMEAYEEGGIVGELNSRVPPYEVRLNGRQGKIKLYIYSMQVKKLLRDWPESGVRDRRVLNIDAALRRVDRKPLRDCIKSLSEKVAEQEKTESA